MTSEEKARWIAALKERRDRKFIEEVREQILQIVLTRGKRNS